jgi:mannose-6-phosphate isomerase-like protein (cupin superfamily)
MDVQTVDASPLNERGGQSSYLLLDRGQFGSGNLSVTWVECPPGSEQPSHLHETSEQVYVIVRGCGMMRVGAEEREVAEGALVFIPPATPHAIRNASDAGLIYVSATSPPFATADLAPVFSYRPQS